MSATRVFSVLLVLCLGSSFAVPASAAAESETITSSLIKAPRPETAPQGAAILDVSGRYFISEPDIAGDTLIWGPDATLRVGVLEMAEIGIGVISRDKSAQFAVGQVRLNLMKESDNWPAIGAGVLDMTSEKHPGGDDIMPATNSDEYITKNKNFSIYGVLAKGLWNWGRVYLGFGNGRFVSEAGASEDLKGLLGGGELYLGPVRAMAECDGRYLNAGLGVNFTGGNVGKSVALIDLIVAGRYLQNARSSSQDLDLRPALVGMLSVGLVPSKAGTAKTKSEEK